MIELLAPAGNTESLTAALRCGADAVYIGGKSFSARQNASNFDIDEMKQAVRLCHRYGAALHIAVNTIITDSQLSDFISEIKQYAALSPDAFIVQDPGAAYIIKNISPDIPLHASTQMTIHSLKGAMFAKSLGFSRVVISREASADMISSISAAGIETEIFVHGALCMSVSGQCYMSAMIGSRSANRGLCAQTCRLPFSPAGHPDEHCLSLRDLSLISHIEKIKSLGVSSLKIEGRMKRPEYVAAAVSAYRNALDGLNPDTETLKAAFSRNGFTDGYFTGRKTFMFGMRDKDDVMSSAQVIPELKQLYRKERKVSELNLDVHVRKGEKVTLKVSDTDGYSCTVYGNIPDTAVNKPINEEFILRQISKLGDTIYNQGKITIHTDEGLSVPASVLNSMRREAVEKLYALREQTAEHVINNDFTLHHTLNEKKEKHPAIRIRAERYSVLEHADTKDAEYIILPLNEIIKNISSLSNIKQKIIIEPPRFIFNECDIEKTLKNLFELGFSHIMCCNVAYISIGKQIGFRLHGDFGLNTANSCAAEVFCECGMEDITLSFELKLSQIEKLKSPVSTGIIAYGKLPLMLTVNCPVKNSSGCKNCRHSIKDRTGRNFRVQCTNGYTEIFNHDPLYLADKPEALSKTDFITLFFTDESEKETRKIILDYTGKTDSSPSGITRGLYYRGIK